MNCLYRLVIIFVGVLVFESISASETPCPLHSLGPVCLDPNESCNQRSVDTGVCKCKAGYTKRHPTEPCIQTRSVTPAGSHSDDQPTTPEAEYSSKVSGSTIAASILIPLVLIVAVVGLVYAARRYQWLHRLQHLRRRRYDEVRIGQEDDDDPPIA